jgi:heme-degrading monooxygenase HmoA
MAVRVYLTMTVPAQAADDFVGAWTEVARFAQSASGCLRQTLTREDGTVTTFHISSDWATIDQFREFERSDAQDAATARLRALRLDGAMRVSPIVAHLDGVGA